ncbi:hypothetical protein AB0L85_28115 [Streptomyces sp. NPDC052051]|uniref:hypothetical protein n=1 Tax=Streptomyces sp. NPDC052051 TaxID=3154649 RepID=UPI00342A6667
MRKYCTYYPLGLAEFTGKKILIGADSSGIDPMSYRHVEAHLGTADLSFPGRECDGAPFILLHPAPLTPAMGEEP